MACFSTDKLVHIAQSFSYERRKKKERKKERKKKGSKKKLLSKNMSYIRFFT